MTEETEQQQELDTKELSGLLNLPEEELKKQLQYLSDIMKVFDGKTLDGEDLISFNVNLKDIKERTRFLTFPLLKENVYFRLHAHLYPEIAISGKYYADTVAKSLISYKGLSREEFRDIRKAAQPTDERGTVIGSYTAGAVQQQPKKRFWQRTPKTESEFDNT